MNDIYFAYNTNKNCTFNANNLKIWQNIFKSSYKYLILISLDKKIKLHDDFYQKMISPNFFISYCNNNQKDTIDYQKGSFREDFDFGGLMVINLNIVRQLNLTKYDGCILYAIRLLGSINHKIIHINEKLFDILEENHEDFEEQNFSYVKAQNQNYQQKCQEVFLDYLQILGAKLPVMPKVENFDNIIRCQQRKISVIIPVFNREKTIKDAVISAINQKTDFDYNILVVDNHSSDNTNKILQEIQQNYPNKVKIIVPKSNDLKIGGCWMLAANDVDCGAICCQLDSDDVYSNENVLQTIYQKFIIDKCAMLIGSYQLTDIDLKDFGLEITHKEYTFENGHNNALRVNGLGAPRCYLTKILRENPMENVSYGEDYGVCLKITGKYQISRIFNILYYCRRWFGNSDNNPSWQLTNQRNFYKDSLRTKELENRIKLLEK